MSDNYSFQGDAPPGVSVADNVFIATQYQATHTPQETFNWFYEQVRNNKDGHLPTSQSMDYKQIDSKYADFGNYNYGAVGRSLGIPDIVLEYGAGWAQGKADGLSDVEALVRALLDPENRGDNSGDQELIRDGMDAAREHGFTDNDLGITEYLEKSILDNFLEFSNWLNDIGRDINDFFNFARNWFQRKDPLTLDLGECQNFCV